MNAIIALTDHESAAIRSLEASGQFIGGLADRLFDWLLAYTAWWDAQNTYVLIFILPELNERLYGPLKVEADWYAKMRQALNPDKEFRLGAMARRIDSQVARLYQADGLWQIGFATITSQDERMDIYD
jgi:hypothetical protein